MSKVKWTIVILASIAALTMAIIALYSPWWSESYKIEENNREYGFSWALDELSAERVYTKDLYRYNCPSCGDNIADSVEELIDEREHCPECGYYVSEGPGSCRWCDATFEKAAIECNECDELFIDPVKEIFRQKGDIQKETHPLSNTDIDNAEEDDGIMNRVELCNNVRIIWLFGVFIAALSVLALIISGLYGRLPKPVIISMGIASVLILVGVVYYSASWTGAYEDDWNDIYGEEEEYREQHDMDSNFGLFKVPDEKDEPVPAVNSFSGYKKHQPEIWYEYYREYSWGPRSGWIIGLISSILLTGTTVLLYVFRDDLDDDDDDDEDYEDEDEEDENEPQYRQREKSHSKKTSKYPPPPVEKKCIKCSGVIIDPKAVFCHTCGASQSHRSPAPMSKVANAPQTVREPVQSPLATKPELVNCSNCSSLNLATADSCMMCGAILKGRPTGPYSSAQAYSLPQRYTYPPPPTY
ncbi:MAG: hypothetical protein QGH39_07815 [Candidatus Thermoplasmatota archaeon]|nr:hypothetical protein [Candidatus Thermoplasmatota archaeon]